MADYTKSADDDLEYTFDWSSETTDRGDTIATSSTAVPTGLTLEQDDNNSTSATVQISGGRHGVTYIITNTITLTTSGETLEKSFSLRIDDYPSVA